MVKMYVGLCREIRTAAVYNVKWRTAQH